MSHVVVIRTEIRDRAAIEAACRRLCLKMPENGTTRLFSTEVSGLLVELPGWRYPVVCQLRTGELKYDNYEGRWGDEKELGKLLQAYAVELAKSEALRKGHQVHERALSNGDIRLTVELKGGAT